MSDKLFQLRASGLTSLEIADQLGLTGSDRYKKNAIQTTFKVLSAAGVVVGPGRGVGKRGRARAALQGSARQLADATPKTNPKEKP